MIGPSERTKLILADVARGEKQNVVAARYGVSAWTVNSMLDKWRMWKPSDAPPPKSRVCMLCRDQFMSAWAGNRLCVSCKGSDEFGGYAATRV